MDVNPYDSPQTECKEVAPTTTPDKPWWKLTLVEYLVIAAIIAVLIALMLPNVRQSRGDYTAMNFSNQLKQIGLALHNYHDVHGVFPPAYVTDEQGQPLYSWRVLILPYLEQEDTYQRFDLTQSWDSKTNRALIAEMPSEFVNPCARERAANGETSCVALVDTFEGRTVLRAGKGRSLQEIPDGASSTGMVVSQPDHFVTWTAPVDVDPLEFLASAAQGQTFRDELEWVFVLWADGSVTFTLRTDELPALIYCDDGRVVSR